MERKDSGGLMTQLWQLLHEVRGDEQQGIEGVRSAIARMGVARAVANRLVGDLADSLSALPGDRNPPPAMVTCRIFVPTAQGAGGDAFHDWAFFLVSEPGCGPGADAADGPAVIEVFLYPAVPGGTEPGFVKR